MRYRLLVLLAIGCSSTSSAPPANGVPAQPTVAVPLRMSDVSILFPIPSSPAAPGHLGPTTTGGRGPLLPRDVFDAAPTFPVRPTEGLDYGRMRAVGVRFDGCFQVPSGCEAQIRLVMQPITDDGGTRDSALHLFYHLTDEELAEVVAGLRHLQSLSPEVEGGPLDVHASLIAQGMEGAYAQGLVELILQHAGEQNLTRMTFFLRAPPINDVWFFGGVSRTNGKLEPLDIVGVGKSNQRVILDTTEGGFTYDFTPVETKPEDTNLLLSSERIRGSSEAEMKTALEAFARIENPTTHGADALPCGGCHVSTAVTTAATTHLGLDVKDVSGAFTSTHDLGLKGEAASTPRSLRAFGWFGKRPMISQRVVNETALVVDDFETRFPAK